MTQRVRRSDRAEHDLDEIFAYVAADSLSAAERLIVRLEAAEERLGEYPQLAAARDEFRLGLRIWPIGSYLILYRTSPDAVEIIRILHGARDLGEALEDL